MTIVAADMRHWEAPQQADILVSELLGSFGDNELSPECLDGAQKFLRQGGISIPQSYTSFLQPITTAKLWNDVKVKHRGSILVDGVCVMRVDWGWIWMHYSPQHTATSVITRYDLSVHELHTFKTCHALPHNSVKMLACLHISCFMEGRPGLCPQVHTTSKQDRQTSPWQLPGYL